LDRDIFAHYLGLVLGLDLEPLASILASSSLVLALASDLWHWPQDVWPR